MKRLFSILALAGALTAFAVSITAQQPPEKGEPFTAPEVKSTEGFFTRRLVKIRNGTEEKLAVSLLYRTLDDGNAWIWLPGEPGTGEPLSFEIDPGQEVLVDVGGKPITASRIRLWATGQTLQFNSNKEEDIWTVPEVDEQEHRYKALEMDTFAYVFSPSAPPPPPPGPEGVDNTQPPPGPGTGGNTQPPPGPEVVDNTLPQPLPGDTVTPQPNIAIESPVPAPIAPDLQPAPLLPPIVEPAPVDVIPLPPFLPMPMPAIPFPQDADLVAAAFKIDATGIFSGTVLNAGAAGFPGGRRWFVLKSTGGPAKFGSVVAQGDINALQPNGAQEIAGAIGQVSFASRYILALSPGDSKRLNDFSGVVFLQAVTARSDLAAKVALLGTKLVGTITNNGPEPFNGDGKRTFQLGDKSGLVAPLLDKVPALAVGASVDVTLDVTAAVSAKTLFFLALNAGDDFKINDSAVLPHNPKGKPVNLPDLEAKTLVLKGNKLVGTIVNHGPGNYLGGRTFFLGNNSANKLGSVAPLNVGASQTVELALPLLLLTTNQGFKLHVSGDDSKPANNSIAIKHATKAPDLAVSLAITGNKVKGIITNHGAGSYDGVSRTFTLSAPALGTTYQTGTVGKLKENETFAVNLTLPAGAPTQAVVFSLNNGDSKPVNDIATKTFTPDEHDLKVTLKITGTNAHVTIANVGATAYPAAGKRTVTIERPGLKSITVPVPGPISKGGSKADNFPLTGATPGAKVTVKLSPGDSNKGNDTANAIFSLFDLVMGKVTLKGTTFSIPISNKGPAYTAGDAYVITGPGGFKETGKIPNIPAGGTDTVTHAAKAKLDTGTFTITLNVKDSDPANNKKTVIHKAALDLALGAILIKGTTFVIPVANKGLDYAGGDPYTITGPGGFKETGKIPLIPAGGNVNILHAAKAKLDNGTFTVTLNVKDLDIANNKKDVIHKTALDLALGVILIKGTTFVIPVANKGPDYAGGDPYTITGPGGFKENGKIPLIPAGGNVNIMHAAKAKLDNGTFTVTLNVKDLDVANNKKDVIHKTALDLALGVITIKGATFSIPLTNKGPDYGGGDSYTITGPVGFKETGKIPKLAAGGVVTITHAAKAKLGNGTFTVTLNVKDDNLANNSGTLVHKVLTLPTLAIASITRDGKMVAITLKNEGTGNYISGGGVVFKLQHQTGKKGGLKNLPEPAIPNIAAGASVTFQVPDPGVGALTGTLTGTANEISNDPNKNKKTVK